MSLLFLLFNITQSNHKYRIKCNPNRKARTDLHWGGAISTAKVGALTWTKLTPIPSMNRPPINIPLFIAAAITAVATMIMELPTNIVHRRPIRSQVVPAKREPASWPIV